MDRSLARTRVPGHNGFHSDIRSSFAEPDSGPFWNASKPSVQRASSAKPLALQREYALVCEHKWEAYSCPPARFNQELLNKNLSTQAQLMHTRVQSG